MTVPTTAFASLDDRPSLASASSSNFLVMAGPPLNVTAKRTHAPLPTR
jgi:hypothetical protein